MTYLVYPGASHKRFEHSLGVMELASRVFDTVTDPDNVTDRMKNLLEPLRHPDQLAYWRRVLRMAALCHDIGHLPFSHAAEEDLLPNGWDHERLTQELISGDELKEIWEAITPPLRHQDIVKLAVGPKGTSGSELSDWEAILAEIIVGDAFGVDRMDYLLRDSHHVGVAYGRFDHYRLIDTLRILPSPEVGEGNGSSEPMLGMDEGGIQSAEALMLARYFMYSQVYFHHIRRIYDTHLKDFLKDWLSNGVYSTNVDDHLDRTDSEIITALWKAAFDGRSAGHAHARRIVRREHFRRVYERNPDDIKVNPEAGQAIFRALGAQFGDEVVRHDRYSQKSRTRNFPVKMRDDRIVSSLAMSETLSRIPVLSIDNVYVDASRAEDARGWFGIASANHREDQGRGGGRWID